MINPTQKSGNGRSGCLGMPFTLIELLVVIAIIAILASMLLPSLQKARAMGKQTTCLGNLRQVAVANASYRDDNNDRTYFSGEIWLAGSGSWKTVHVFLLPYMGYSDSLLNDDSLFPWSGRVAKNFPALTCPAATYQGIAYGQNMTVFMSGSGPNVRASTISSPSDLIETPEQSDRYWGGAVYAIGDNNAIRLDLRNGGTAEFGRLAAFHGGMRTSNFAFLDGHAASMQANEFDYDLAGADCLKYWFR